MTSAVHKIFDQVYRVPSIPEVVSRLIQELTLPTVNFDAIARDVSRDQAIALKVLRMVNSAYFGLSRKLTAIDEAVLTLGVDKLTTLIIASGMVGAVPQMRGFDLRAFWRFSLRRATYAKGIATMVNGCVPNTAFTCGLIADFGRLLMRMADPEASDRVEAGVADGSHRETLERAEFGCTAAEVAADLCRRWHFPEILQRGVAQAGEPMAFPEFETLAAVVHLGGVLSTLKAREASAHEVPAALPEGVVKALRLGDAELQQIAFRIYDSDSGLETLAA